jgi:hypothetical protein
MHVASIISKYHLLALTAPYWLLLSVFFQIKISFAFTGAKMLDDFCFVGFTALQTYQVPKNFPYPDQIDNFC